jgi:ribokinase
MHIPRQPPIAVIGDINADLTLTVPTYPAQGDDVAAQAMRWGSGGAALNMASMFARLGAQAQLIGRVGSDNAAMIALHVARDAGVDLSCVQHDQHEATGICTAVVGPDGQRTFFTYRGANLLLELDSNALAAIEACELLAVTAYALLEPQQRASALHAISCAAAHGIPLLLDLCLPAARLCAAEIDKLLPQLWLLTMNEAELHTLLPGQSTIQAIETLLRAGVQHVVVKRGSQGCSAATEGQLLDVLPPAVDAFDTNGCGDAFTAGFAWGLMCGADLSASANLGNLLGALTAARPGSADALPTRPEILQYLDLRLHTLLTNE